MARKSTPGAKKKTAAKALAQELAVARKSPSARRAASGRRATLDEDDDPPATDTQASAPASAPSLVSTSAPTSARRTRTRTGARPLAPASDNGMFTCYCHSQLTALTGDAAPAATALATAPASAPSLVSTSAPTSARRTRMCTGARPLAPASDNGMFTCYCHSQLTALTGDAAPAATGAEAPRDQSPAGAGTVTDPNVAADFAILRGECSTLLSTPEMNFL